MPITFTFQKEFSSKDFKKSLSKIENQLINTYFMDLQPYLKVLGPKIAKYLKQTTTFD